MGERPWRFEVSCESRVGGSMAGEDPADPEAWWTWAIFDGPTDPDDLVLCGVTDTGDPTPVLEQIVARHNAAQPQGMEGAQGLTHHDSGRFGRAPVPTPRATRRGPSAADSLEPQGQAAEPHAHNSGERRMSHAHAKGNVPHGHHGWRYGDE